MIKARDKDRLYGLLPIIYRIRDASSGYPLKALLRVITEQADVIEDDIAQLYDDWFIETCRDWVVPYIADLIGYRQTVPIGETGAVLSEEDRLRFQALIPRREVAGTLGFRRRKGTLALLEILANQIAGWPARAVEFKKLLDITQPLNHLYPARGRTVDVREMRALERLSGPFESTAHTIDVRRPSSTMTPGRYNLTSVGLFVWRLHACSVTTTAPYCREDVDDNCFTFSILGDDVPLFNRAVAEASPDDIAGELNVPAPIRRWALAEDLDAYYGEDKSLFIWAEPATDGDENNGNEALPARVPASRIIVADLSDWRYRPEEGYVAVDPELGRIVFPPGMGIWRVRVSYHYGQSASIGGGEYTRPIVTPELSRAGGEPRQLLRFEVGPDADYKTIPQALKRWKEKPGTDALIELTASDEYNEPFSIDIKPDCRLYLRAKDRVRPVLRFYDRKASAPDSLRVVGGEGSRVVLEGLIIAGRGVRVIGPMQSVKLRHTTIVPGWSASEEVERRDRQVGPSMELVNVGGRVVIQSSIVGRVVIAEEGSSIDPLEVIVEDSIIDAKGGHSDAIAGPEGRVGRATLTVRRATIFGKVRVHAIERAEDTIFMSPVHVARRQIGCVRFCYVPPSSRTPRRYECQPDLVESAARGGKPAGQDSERDAAALMERGRVSPVFQSTVYRAPSYCQLADICADEIKRGADDESEMGVYHDLFAPQREANLRARLDEYVPAGWDAGIIHAT